MGFSQASFGSSFWLCIICAEVLVMAAEKGGVQLNGEQTAGAKLVSLRPATQNQYKVNSSKGLSRQTAPKKEDMALTQRMVSMNFVDTDWSTGCVWGFLFGWIAAVLWTVPAVFAASTRSPSHISPDTPVWSIQRMVSMNF